MTKKKKTPKNKTENTTTEPGTPLKGPNGYTGQVPEIDYESAKKRAKEYEETIIKPEEKAKNEEAKQEFDEIIETEKQFLDFFNPDNHKLEILYAGKLLKIEIQQIDPETNDLSLMEMDSGEIYADMTPQEQEIITKTRAGIPLTKKEQETLSKLNMNKKEIQVLFKSMHEILSQLVVKPRLTKEQWENTVPLDLRLFLYEEVTTRVGINNKQQPKLFQAR